MYRDEEKRIFDEVAKHSARKFAETNSQQFFARDKHSKADWDIISAPPSIENPYIFRSRLKKKQIPTENWEYTRLQQWVNENVSNFGFDFLLFSAPARLRFFRFFFFLDFFVKP